jgi:hypothetical protein
MENREHKECLGFVDYMAGEMSDVERKRFERHLETCAECREDVSEWRLVWDRLSDEAPLHPLPSDLKMEVMDVIFAQEDVSPLSPRKRGRLQRPFRGLALAVALAVAFAAGFGWQNLTPPSRPAAYQAMQNPSDIEQLYHLDRSSSVEDYKAGKAAYGIACILRTEGERRLVVYTFGAAPTEGDGVYQVWLLKDGKRQSAGIFTVGESGVGLLTIPWTDESPVFDQVGVTLEPDRHSASPRGPRLFQSV